MQNIILFDSESLNQLLFFFSVREWGKGVWGIGRDLIELHVKSPAMVNIRENIISLVIDISISISDTDCRKNKKKERKRKKNTDEDLLHIPLAMKVRFVLHYIFITSYKHVLSIQMIIILSSWGLVTSLPSYLDVQKTVLFLAILQFLLIPSIFILNNFFTSLPLGQLCSISWQQLGLKRNL